MAALYLLCLLKKLAIGRVTKEKVMEKSVDELYVEIVNIAKDLGGARANLETVFKKGGYMEKQENIETAFQTLHKSIKDEYVTTYPSSELQHFYNLGVKLSNRFKNFDEKFNQRTLSEVATQKEVRKAERQDLWKLWRDKLGRWIVGVSLAIAMYSLFVKFSEWWGFIKIPVRDLVVG